MVFTVEYKDGSFYKKLCENLLRNCARKLQNASRGLHGARGRGDAAGVGGGEVAGKGKEIEVDEGVAHGVVEGVPRRPAAGVPDAALVEPCGATTAWSGAASEGEAEEEEEGKDGGGD